jgi:nitrogen fixation NifU-like protein
MNADLRELYQEIIIDHNRDPRNHHVMADATTQAEGYNPLCGDKLTVYVRLVHDAVVDLSFKGCGCAISQASASLMTEALKGKTVAEAHKIFKRVHQMLTKDTEQKIDSLGKLAVLAGVKAFPVRVKCATLAWHTLEAALNKEKGVVQTE